MEFQQLISDLKIALNTPLPGDKARELMAPSFRWPPNTAPPNLNTAKKSAVLLLLFPFKNSTYTAYMKRTEDGHAHSGQISLPGGRHEDSDLNLTETALRETEEEFGIKREKIEIIGKLSSMHIPASNSLVQPFVGMLNDRPKYIPSVNEVKEIIETDLKYLVSPDIISEKEITASRGIKLTAPYYDLHGHTLWGATAMITAEFIYLLNKSK